MKIFAKSQKISIIIFFIGIFFFFSCSDDNTISPNTEKVLISENFLTKYSADLLKALGEMMGVNITPEYPVTMYRITYKSGFRNKTCSGYICLPDTNIHCKGIVLIQHPTSFNDNEVQGNYALLACATASLGYVTITNDYIGFGESIDEVQTYHIAEYSSLDAISALQATNEFIEINKLNTSSELRLVGYSQGGYNVVAIQKELEKKNEFNLKEVYSGAAPLVLTSLMRQILTQDDYESTYYLPQFIISYNNYYSLNLDYNKVYQSSFITIIDDYYNVKNTDEKWRNLPKKASELLTETFINEILKENNPFYQKLRENNLNNFSPKNKLYLYGSENDDAVFHNILVESYEYYNSQGGNVELVKSKQSENHKNTHTEFFEFVLKRLQVENTLL